MKYVSKLDLDSPKLNLNLLRVRRYDERTTIMMKNIELYTSSSDKIKTDDLSWDLAAKHGLTEEEVFALTYFADIESQTIRYLRMLLGMKIAFREDVAAFLSIWNYEEFYHGHYLGKLMRVCGHATDTNRVAEVQSHAKFNEILESILTPLFSKIFYRDFPAVYLSFGAIQEMTTLLGYESMGKKTTNPVLKVLCERIAKQERRHFAWYFNHAKSELSDRRFAQQLTYALMKFNWVPVGAGVKPTEDVVRLFNFLFPGDDAAEVADKIDEKMGTLPGLHGIELMRPYVNKHLTATLTDQVPVNAGIYRQKRVLNLK